MSNEDIPDFPQAPAPTPDDRSIDLSQPLDRLSSDETLKKESDYLRGTIAQGLLDPLTGGLSERDQKLTKFHGLYQQDDRDLREERRRQKLEPAYQFMLRVRLPGGVCTPTQWLMLDRVADDYANGTLRMTTRQTFQFHGVLKRSLKPLQKALNQVTLDSIAACGDDTRGVMCAINPALSHIHAEVYGMAKAASDHMTWQSGAYHEIWLDGELKERVGEEEPFYGPTYMPRKFKIGFAVPPSNDIDVYTQDLGFIAIIEDGELQGFNVSLGGGMGRTDNDHRTYPRLGDVICYVPKDAMMATSEAVASIQREHGNRADRSVARFKYTVDRKGLDWMRAELARRLGRELEAPRPFRFTDNGDTYGWAEGTNGDWHFTLYIENGRVADLEGYRLRSGLRAIAEVHKGTMRLTPNQNLIIADIAPAEKDRIAKLLDDYGISASLEKSVLRRSSMACVAFPTCGLAMAESERYMPALLTKLEAILAENGLSEVPIVTRMSGCNNGCSRPYVAEIGFSGRAPGKYNLYLGGGHHGERLARMYLENVAEPEILEALSGIIRHFAAERTEQEHFGDFVIRAGYVSAVTSGWDFNRPNIPRVSVGNPSRSPS
jgi:sulfite reductase (NADPH) hemoprotein beta-component